MEVGGCGEVFAGSEVLDGGELDEEEGWVVDYRDGGCVV